MLIGNGMITRRFRDYADRDDVIIYASGVSNSKEVQPEPYIRDRQLVEHTLQQTMNRLFVYFSTASVDDTTEQGSRYVTYKLDMERVIARQARNYLIIRASNVVGGPGNPHTIVNFFMNRVLRGEPFSIWQYATRNLIDLDDVYSEVTRYIANPATWNQTVPVCNSHSISPLTIVRAIERHTGRKATYEILTEGVPGALADRADGSPLFAVGDDTLSEQYMARLLKKYYP